MTFAVGLLLIVWFEELAKALKISTLIRQMSRTRLVAALRMTLLCSPSLSHSLAGSMAVYRYILLGGRACIDILW